MSNPKPEEAASRDHLCNNEDRDSNHTCGKPKGHEDACDWVEWTPTDKKIYSQRDMEAAGEVSLPEIVWAECAHTHYTTSSVREFRDAALRELQRLRDLLDGTERDVVSITKMLNYRVAECERLESELHRVKEENAALNEFRAISVAGVIRDESVPCGWRNKRAEIAEAELAALKAREAPEDAWKRAWIVALQIPKSNSHYAPEYIAPERSK